MPTGSADLVAAEIAAQIPRRRTPAPSGFEPGVRYDPATGIPAEVTTEPIPRDVTGDPDQWAALTAHLLPQTPAGYRLQLVEARYDPVAWTRDTQFALNPTTEEQVPAPALTRPAWRYRFRVVPDDTTLTTDTAALVGLVRSHRRRPARRSVAAARVVAISDLQVGKVDRDGGTDALLERVSDKLDKIDDLWRSEPVHDLVLLDPGDLIENFTSTTQQTHTNDLSLPDQLNVARVVLTEIVDRLSARAKRTRVATVGSNHGQWRTAIGKNARAGRPDADFGIDVHRAVAQAHHLAKRRDVTFVIPEPWRESLALEVAPGFVVGLVHGHQWNAGKAGDWWKGQTHGDGPTAGAHMLVHGHWHNASLAQSGNFDGRPRWIVGVDAMDGGSAWWENLTGERSEPSITTFLVTDDGRWDAYRRIT